MSNDNQVNRPPSTPLQEPHLISRFSIAVLAFTLIGIGIGATIPPGFGPLALGTGLVGLIAYVAVVLVGSRTREEALAVVRARSEDRLARHLRQTDGDIAQVEGTVMHQLNGHTDG